MIYVLLILAGVSIAVLTGENGIINRATTAKQTNEQKTAEEELKLGVSALSIDYRKNTTNAQTFKQFVTANNGEKLKDAMGLTGDDRNQLTANSETGVVTYKGATYRLTDDGKISEATPVTITFNLNGGSVDNSTAAIVKNTFAGDTVELPLPTQTGYKVKGWYDLAEEGNLVYATNTATITAPSSNSIVYAQWEEKLTYGAPAALGTVTVNNTALLKGWRYFYNDGSNIYLIYENYLESTQMPESTTNGIATDGYNVYVDTTNYSGKDRRNLVNYLNDESTSTSGIWSGLAAGVQNALAAKNINATVKAKGAPMLEQFAGSYQANYPNDEFEVAYRNSTDKIDGTNGTLSQVNAEGYVYKKKEQSWAYYQSLGNSENGKDLYFPETSAVKPTGQTNDTYGYWLARSFCLRLYQCVQCGLQRLCEQQRI